MRLSMLWLIWIGSTLHAKELLVASSKKSVEHKSRLLSAQYWLPTATTLEAIEALLPWNSRPSWTRERGICEELVQARSKVSTHGFSRVGPAISEGRLGKGSDAILSATYQCSVGSRQLRSSKVPAVSHTVFGSALKVNVGGLPHRPQWLRVAPGLSTSAPYRNDNQASEAGASLCS